jgi:hypothetical protein
MKCICNKKWNAYAIRNEIHMQAAGNIEILLYLRDT